MIPVAKEWNPKQALLKNLLSGKDKFDEAIRLALALHELVHTSEMSHTEAKTFEDEVWEGLDESAFRIMPTAKDVTTAWNIWHITRIEDLTANILIANGTQVFSENDWMTKMNVAITDTGNAMSDAEILAFSSAISMKELRNYRIAVGRKTREILSKLQPSDLKRKAEASSLRRILHEGGVLDVDGSKWLLDFWGRKTIAGIILMPITRHQLVHINDSLKLKEKCKKRGATR